MKICSAENCDRKIRCKGLCSTHYYKTFYPTQADRPKYNRKKSEDSVDTDDFWEFVKRELKIEAPVKTRGSG